MSTASRETARQRRTRQAYSKDHRSEVIFGRVKKHPIATLACVATAAAVLYFGATGELPLPKPNDAANEIDHQDNSAQDKDGSQDQKPKDKPDKPQQQEKKKEKPEPPQEESGPEQWSKALSELLEEAGVVVATGNNCIASSLEENRDCIERAATGYQEVNGVSAKVGRFAATCGVLVHPGNRDAVTWLADSQIILDGIGDSANKSNIKATADLCEEAVTDILESPFAIEGKPDKIIYGIPGQ